MSNYDNTGRLWDSAGALTGVRHAVRFDDMIVGVQLEFQGAVASCYANGDYDTISIELSRLEIERLDDDPEADAEYRVVSVAAAEPCSRAIGLKVSWIWLMTNQQGYEDGVRFEFQSKDKSEWPVVELVVVGSAFQVFSSQKHRFRGDGSQSEGTA